MCINVTDNFTMAAFYFFIILFTKFTFITCEPIFNEESSGEDIPLFDLSDVDCTAVLAFDIGPGRENESQAELNDITTFRKETTGLKSVTGEALRIWPRGRIPIALDVGLSKDEKKSFKCAIKFFLENTCLDFVQPREYDDDYVLISANKTGCQSYVGREGGVQIVNLEKSSTHCWNKGTIIHELMHAIGFFHEQQRDDRGSFVEILWENIPTKHYDQFRTAAELNYKQKLVGAYDYKSIMHYKRWLYKKAAGPTMNAKINKNQNNKVMGNRNAPTEMDVFKINTLYKCNGIVHELHNKSVILLLGGTTQTKNGRYQFLSKTAEIYKPPIVHPSNVSIFSDLAHLGTGRRLHFAAVVNGTVIVGGGYTFGRALDTTEILDLSAPEYGWKSGPRMINKRFAATVAVVNGQLYVCGGKSKVRSLKGQKSCETLHKEQKQFRSIAPMSIARSSATAVGTGIFMFVIGGADDDDVESVERYTPQLNEWHPMAPLRDIKCEQNCAAAALGSYIYVCGGRKANSESEDTKMNECKKYSPTLDAWIARGSMLNSRRDFNLVNFNGQLMAIGGQEHSSLFVEVYDEDNDTWNITGQIAKRRWSFAAVAV